MEYARFPKSCEWEFKERAPPLPIGVEEFQGDVKKAAYAYRCILHF